MHTNTQTSLPGFSQLNGIFVLDKPCGPSSAQCLKIFKKMGQKKVGHAGTLDPAASGVLPVLLGSATKIQTYLQNGGKKIYRGKIQLGVETDTWDMDGHILRESSWENVKEEDVKKEIHAWPECETQQVPPFSAARHNGQRLYNIARKGGEPPLKTKEINIFNVEILHLAMPYAEFRVMCGSGSYIRSLAHSLGKRLGCGAALCGLTREYSQPFSIEKACSLENLRDNPHLLNELLLPLDAGLPDWPKIRLTARQASTVRYGGRIAADEGVLTPLSHNKAILMEGTNPLALASLEKGPGGYYWTIMRGLWN